MYSLVAEGIGKRFGARKVFADISFEVQPGEPLAIVGPNGSGKSTLIMLLLGLYHPTRGSSRLLQDGLELDEPEIRQKSSLVSPYLNLYDYLTAEENIAFLSTVAGGKITGKQINSLLTRVGLEGRGEDLVGAYSSGMKQRLKYAVALLNKPAFLFLDEPNSNLDDSGRQIVREIIDEYAKASVVIIATNEEEEYSLARQQCRLG